MINVTPLSPFQNRSDDWHSICYERVGFRIFCFNIKNTSVLTKNTYYVVYRPGSSISYTGNSSFFVSLRDPLDHEIMSYTYQAQIVIQWISDVYSFCLYVGNTSIPENTEISFVLVTLQY